jgi:hypothetical protein
MIPLMMKSVAEEVRTGFVRRVANKGKWLQLLDYACLATMRTGMEGTELT